MKIDSVEAFAKAAGAIVIACDGDHDGKFGYTEKDANWTVVGFKTEKAAYDGWFRDEFGEVCAKAIKQLIKQANRK